MLPSSGSSEPMRQSMNSKSSTLPFVVLPFGKKSVFPFLRKLEVSQKLSCPTSCRSSDLFCKHSLASAVIQVQFFLSAFQHSYFLHHAWIGGCQFLFLLKEVSLNAGWLTFSPVLLYLPFHSQLHFSSFMQKLCHHIEECKQRVTLPQVALKHPWLPKNQKHYYISELGAIHTIYF